jgi:hypothetical protein
MSAKDRLERKKYMGVCRWGSEMIVRIMSRFPKTVVKYIDRNSPKRRDCRSESSVNPRRIKFPVPVWFLFSMGLLGLQKEGKMEHKIHPKRGFLSMTQFLLFKARELKQSFILFNNLFIMLKSFIYFGYLVKKEPKS